MHSSNDDHNILVLGGVIFAIAIGMMIVRAVGEFFRELAITFTNFGHMCGSLLFLLWNVAEVAILVSMILGVTAGGVYFVARYFRAVREFAESREWLTMRTKELETSLYRMSRSWKESVDTDIAALNERLTSALKKPEVIPIAPEMAAPAMSEAPAPASDEIPTSNPF
jgi:hypothetical protein